jgi:tetratricopeptide (TPR) repeat protein
MGEEQPATALRAARLGLGWKQSKTINALTTQARRDGVGIAAPASLKTMLSRWENGKGQPDAVYQRLFCEVYARDADELSFAEATPAQGSSAVGPDPGVETVEYVSAVLQQHILADQLIGPHHLTEVVRAQTDLLDQILLDAESSSVTDDLLRLACRYNEFAGWLHQDAGLADHAMAHSDRAMEIALSLENSAIIAYLLMRKANIASDQGKIDRAASLAEAGVRMLARVPPRVRALVLAPEARAHALRGQVNECARSLDAAFRQVSRPDSDSDELAPYCSPEYVGMEAAACWAILGQTARAIPIFERALDHWPAGQRRDQGLCQARLAKAYAERGDAERAAETGQLAVSTVRVARSARAVRELGRVRETLAPWRRETEVSELNARIKGLTHRQGSTT